MTCLRTIPIIALISMAPSAIAQTTFYVNGSCGNDAWTGTSSVCTAPNGPKRTIQAGIDASVTADTVIVADGTYTGAGNRDLDFGGRDIHLRSESLDPTLCIIDCQGSENDPHRGFYFHSGETNAAMVEGFTVRNGFVTFSLGFPSGGGIRCNGASPTIEGCVISNCTAFHQNARAGGVSLEFSTSVIRFCTISDNVATSSPLSSGTGAGGVWITESSAAWLDSCTIARNRSDGRNGGGGVWCLSADAVISDCVISDNTSGAFGGGVRLFDGRVERCVIVGNEALDFFTPADGFGGGVWAQQGEVVDCVISGNVASNRAGGIQSDDAVVVNSLISSNQAPVGGGLFLFFRNAMAINCVITGNFADDGAGVAFLGEQALINSTIVGNTASSTGGGLLVGGFRVGWSTTARVENCILYGNSAPQGAEVAIVEGSFGESSTLDITYCDVAGGEAGVHVVGANAVLNWGAGNIDADPMFVDPGNGDYHISPGSPCIDSGDPAFVPMPGETDFDHEMRVWDGDGNGLPTVDMGADEFGSYVFGDLNCDGAFNGADIDPFFLALGDPSIYTGQFPNCDALLGDMNGDGRLDGADIDPFFQCLGGNCP